MPTSLTNRFLEALPDAERQNLKKLLEPVALQVGTVLFSPQERPRYVHFVTSGMVSLVTIMEDGTSVEVGLCAREGFPESVYLLGPETGGKQGIVQLPGTALRMGFQRFEQEFERNEALRRLVLRLIQYESLVLGQIAACNRLHEVNERLARWLLMVWDRTGEQTMSLTQDFVGQMLGTRRSSVSLAAGELQKAGVIEYKRAEIQILDAERLETVACECTAVIHKLLEGLYR